MSMERVDRSIPGASLSLVTLALLLFLPERVRPSCTLATSGCGGCWRPPRIASHRALLTSADQNTIDPQKRAGLWYRCTRGRYPSNYPSGPGAVLEIPGRATEEVKNRAARLSGEGRISPSCIGVGQAGGSSTKDPGAEIRHRHDVIEVSASAPMLRPYAVHRFFSSVFHIEAGLPVPVLKGNAL